MKVAGVMVVAVLRQAEHERALFQNRDPLILSLSKALILSLSKDSHKVSRS